ncbi:predicted protein [Naegleria gruberi]|uniref:Predicted protein n=1 Tax=Naegleria gruberi TaxID=5762 RepID=D2W498_NAEGR|nr:uncharacterized protein NAEGRDRAFT_76228 [Naegleria gruberi]EFC36101.1 predicted protein [Naegleria gruberi]|eukprot:XP_002668845.1 predicted protein [Naegleria gruberi strain NEG-M]
MEELLGIVQQIKCLTDIELKEINDLLNKNFIRTPNCLKSESAESLAEIGINIRVARIIIDCSTAHALPKQDVEPKVKNKDDKFIEKLEALVEDEVHFKVQFELQNPFEVYDPISKTNIKLGSPYKLSNVKSKLKNYKKSSEKQKVFERTHSLIRNYLVDTYEDSAPFTITRELVEKAEQHESEKKKRKKEEQLQQEKEKRQKGTSD